MSQTQCPECGAPMWTGGRCPWDKGSGCVGRALVERPQRAEPRRVAPVSISTLRAAQALRTRSLSKREYDRQYAARRRDARSAAEMEEHRSYHRAYMRAWREAARA